MIQAINVCQTIVTVQTECRNLIYNGQSFSTCANQTNLVFPNTFTGTSSLDSQYNLIINSYSCPLNNVNSPSCYRYDESSVSTTASSLFFPAAFQSVPSNIAVEIQLLNNTNDVVLLYTPTAVNQTNNNQTAFHSGVTNFSVNFQQTSILHLVTLKVSITGTLSQSYGLDVSVGITNITFTPFDINNTVITNGTILTYADILPYTKLFPKKSQTSPLFWSLLCSTIGCDGISFDVRALSTVNPTAFGYLTSINYQITTPSSTSPPSGRRLLSYNAPFFQGPVSYASYNFLLYNAWFGIAPQPTSNPPLLSTPIIITIAIIGSVVIVGGAVVGALAATGVIGGTTAAGAGTGGAAASSCFSWSALTSCCAKGKKVNDKKKQVKKTRAEHLGRLTKAREMVQTYKRPTSNTKF